MILITSSDKTSCDTTNWWGFWPICQIATSCIRPTCLVTSSSKARVHGEYKGHMGGDFNSSSSDDGMGVSKNRGTPKWMVYNGRPHWNGWFGGYHYFRKHPYTFQKTNISPSKVFLSGWFSFSGEVGYVSVLWWVVCKRQSFIVFCWEKSLKSLGVGF